MLQTVALGAIQSCQSNVASFEQKQFLTNIRLRLLFCAAQEHVIIQTRGAVVSESGGLAPPIRPAEDFVLLEDVPQVYSSILLGLSRSASIDRLCQRL